MKFETTEEGVRVIYDVVREKTAEYEAQPKVSTPEGVERMVRLLQELGQVPQSREAFCVLALDGRHNLIGVQVVSVGTLTTSLVHPREVFKFAIVSGAAAVVVVHNHPSGDSTPSKQDREVTRRLVECGKLIGIPLLDHVVVGDPGDVHSFQRMGGM